MMTPLCPAQQRAFNGVRHGLSLVNVLALSGGEGSGKTTVVTALRDTTGGVVLTLKDVVESMRSRHPLSIEEAYYQLVLDALARHEHVYIDDVNEIASVVGGCGSYPRAGFLESALAALCTYAIEARRKLVLVRPRSSAVSNHGYSFGIGEFTPDDYRVLCRAHLGEAAERLDFDQVHRFAPKLNAHQLRAACVWLRGDAALDTARFVEYLRSQYLASNVNLSEVAPVRLEDLRGVDDVVRALEANIGLPFENDELTRELALKPKRGVLLAGPPGTGKTSVGRALAHRLQSKFFLLDGTFISGSPNFYWNISNLFAEAKQNAPSVIFIDDSDCIFEGGEELGLYRYLLTMLDGLESASSGRVCVMMTAMDISNLPPALIRSGRIELWLEMKLPDAAARAEILARNLASAAALASRVDVNRIADATDGFTGADLKRLVEDAKILLAAERVAEKPARPATDCFLDAVQTMRANRERYAEAEERSRRQRAQRPVQVVRGRDKS